MSELLGVTTSCRALRRAAMSVLPSVTTSAALRLRATFIEIRSVDVGARRRSSSEPAVIKDATPFAEEAAYVEGLAAKLAGPAGAAAAAPISTSGSGSGEAETPAEWPSAKLADRATTTNPGSFGHPELCSRPCIYFAAGRCRNGGACKYCHLDHPTKPAYLSRRQRDGLQGMHGSTARCIVMPLLHRKMSRLGASAGSLLAMDKVTSAWCALDRPWSLGCPAPGRLGSTLNDMSLRATLVVLQYTALQGDPFALACVQELYVQLREDVSHNEIGRRPSLARAILSL